MEKPGMYSEEETCAVLDLMREVFRFWPEERLTVDRVLGSEWMVK